MSALFHEQAELQGGRDLFCVDNGSFEALIFYHFSDLPLLLDRMHIFLLQCLVFYPLDLLVGFIDYFQFFLQILLKFIYFLSIPPRIDRASFIFLEPVLFSSFHLGLNPIHTDQSFTRFPIILGLTLSCLLLGVSDDGVIVHLLLVNVLFLQYCIGLLMHI